MIGLQDLEDSPPPADEEETVEEVGEEKEVELEKEEDVKVLLSIKNLLFCIVMLFNREARGG